MENVAQEKKKTIFGTIKAGEKEIRMHLDGLIRQSFENTMNVRLNVKVDAICLASKSQFRPDRREARIGSCKQVAETVHERYSPMKRQSPSVTGRNKGSLKKL